VLPSLQVTSLANGVRIATEEGSGELASLSIAVESGTRFETAGINGTSALLKELAFAGQANKVTRSYLSVWHSK
jgi:predicted Zn-dependent peptidase